MGKAIDLTVKPPAAAEGEGYLDLIGPGGGVGVSQSYANPEQALIAIYGQEDEDTYIVRVNPDQARDIGGKLQKIADLCDDTP